MKKTIVSFIIGLGFLCAGSNAQNMVPSIYSNITFDGKGRLSLKVDNRYLTALKVDSEHTLSQIKPEITGFKKGLIFTMADENFKGKLYYGFIKYDDGKYPQMVIFKKSSTFDLGKASVNIVDDLSENYDMIAWQEKGFGTLGYRIADENGKILFESKINFKGVGPFEVDHTIIEGPFVNMVGENSATISFKTNEKLVGHVEVNGKRFSDEKPEIQHEINVSLLEPGKEYDYTVVYGKNTQVFKFSTSPKPGTRSSFTFAYASDSRNSEGGGERNVYGTNYYMMKKIGALASMKNSVFMQFTGDLVNGYVINRDEINLQYYNWKMAVQPFWHYMPIYTGMGNHEIIVNVFQDEQYGVQYSVDKFPFASQSAEAAFADNFTNPTNGPDSEDGAYYDPQKSVVDFPSYKENVYYYTYDNVAVIVLNSDYWYAPSLEVSTFTSGNLHGYIMDNQLEWLKKTLKKLEGDNDIDHIFVTQHTPVFPNGGHVKDDMWYKGNNLPRPIINSKAVEKGIIERRDEYLDLLVNKSKKVKAILTGDEHNYCKTLINPEMEMYPEEWEKPKLVLERKIYQINNGAAGAPYYAQEETPWMENTSGFTTQNALVLFHIDGENVKVEVVNPDTLETIESYDLE